MASVIYDSFWDDLQKGNVVPSTDTYYGMLVTSSYAESKTTHAKRSDITNEVAGTAYVAGGFVITATVTKDTVNNFQDIAFSDLVIAASTITARKLVIYKHRGGASSADNLVAVNDFGSDVTSAGSTFTVKGSTIRIKN